MNPLKRIESREAVVSVIGLGYVGLPLAVEFAEAGFRVVGIDLDRGRVESINRGESYVQDVPSERIAGLAVNGSSPSTVTKLRATSDFDALREADAVIICVPTPLSKTRDPDLSNVIAASNEVAKRMHDGMLVVLESTTYPGTTQDVLLPLFASGETGPRNVGKDFFLAFSPERVDPGRADWTVRNTPKVIGGITPECLRVAKCLYGEALETIVPVSSPMVAEMVKLLENTFRATNIALVNEIAIMCDRLGVDVWEVVDAAKTKPFGYMPFYPGPGLGGHCIPVDPDYLAWKMKTLDYRARFIELAAEINFGMPAYVLSKISNALNDVEKAMKGSRVLVLGVTYKADVADLRESPALDLIHLLRGKGAVVEYNDPYLPKIEVEDMSMESVDLKEDAISSADCVVITTDHRSYDWAWVVENAQLIVDTRNATKGLKARAKNLATL